MKKYITIATLLAAGTAIANAELTTVNTEDFSISGATATLTSEGLIFTIRSGFGDLRTDVGSTNAGYSVDSPVFSDPANVWGKGVVGSYLAAGAKNRNLFVTISGYESNQAGIDLSFVAGVPFEGNGEWADNAILNNSFNSGMLWHAGNSASSATSVALTPTTTNVKVSPFNPVVYKYEGVTANENGELSFTIKGIAYHSAGISGIQVTSASPVPEPSAFGLLAGLGALALVASRRRRK